MEILIFLSEGYADWEIAYFSQILNDGDKIKTVALNKSQIHSSGQLNVTVDYSIDEILSLESIEFKSLILCGSTTWRDNFNNPLIKQLVDKFISSNIIVGAICDAVTYLAYNGYLNDIGHSGNSLGYLKDSCPNYTGDKYYKEKQAVKSDLFITANGTGPLEFTYEICKALK